PKKRPESAREVMTGLDAIEHRSSPKAIAPSPASSVPSPRSDPHPIIGRDKELALLYAALDSTHSARGQIALLSGEAGIGKSRLAEAIAGEAAHRGFTIAWGRCWEAGGAPAFWPWVEILRQLADTTTTIRLLDLLGPGARDLAQLVPELAPRLEVGT